MIIPASKPQPYVKEILAPCKRCREVGIYCLTPKDPCHLKKDKQP